MGVQAHPESGGVIKDAALAREVLDLLVAAAGEDPGKPHPRGGAVLRLAPHRSPAQVRRGVPPLTAPRSAVGSQARAVAIVCMLVSGISGRGLGERGGRPVRPREPEPRVASPRHAHHGPGRPARPRPMPGRRSPTATPDRHCSSFSPSRCSSPSSPRGGCCDRPGFPGKVSGVSSVARRWSRRCCAPWTGGRGRGIRPPLRPDRHPAPSRRASGSRPRRASPRPLTVGISIAQTVLVAGSLAIIAQYFRSARVKAWAALQDEAPP